MWKGSSATQHDRKATGTFSLSTVYTLGCSGVCPDVSKLTAAVPGVDS